MGTLPGIISGIGIGLEKVHIWALLNPYLRDYYARITLDLGTIRNKAFAKSVNTLFDSFGQPKEAFKLTIAPEMGMVGNVISPTQTGVAKLYNLTAGNDAVQATQLNQPSLGGRIAPNEKLSLVNGNGQAKYMTHTPISFGATDAWSVTTVLNWDGSANNQSCLFGLIGNFPEFRLRDNGNFNFNFISASVSESVGGDSRKILGRSSIITLVADGLGGLILYLNGVSHQVHNQSSNRTIANFDTFLRGISTDYNGSLSYHSIKAFALTAEQALAESTLLKATFPEIPSVTIGSQVWATSNCQMVCTPMGTVIPEVTDNTAWANSQVLYDNAYAATSGTDEQKTYAAVKATAMWCSYNNDAALGVIYGKLYNEYAILLIQSDIDSYNIGNPTWGYRVPFRANMATLQIALGSSEIAGGKMRVVGNTYWTNIIGSIASTNESGFSALPAGIRNTDGSFSLINNQSLFRSIEKGCNSYLDSYGAFTTQEDTPPGYGFSLRLIKD